MNGGGGGDGEAGVVEGLEAGVPPLLRRRLRRIDVRREPRFVALLLLASCAATRQVDAHRYERRTFYSPNGSPSVEVFARREELREIEFDDLLEDLLGDGIEDVALPRGDRAFLSVLANDGEGRVTPVSETPILGGAVRVRSADFDLDGRMDLVVSDGASREVLVLLSRSAGQITLSLPTVNAANAILVADLNGDDSPDIVVASETEARFAVLLGDGDSLFRDADGAVADFRNQLGAA